MTVDQELDGSTDYDAFISYSHAWDRKVAKAFQNQLQVFDRPWYRPRSLKLFRDETNLAASPHLWREIERGLSRSRWLVVMASPSAAASPWVRQEISWWLTHRSADTLLIAWTDGTLAWDAARTSFDWSQTDALPRQEMAQAFDHEPRWVDLRWLRSLEQASSSDPRLIECVAEFVAPLTGRSKDELIGDHVRQRRRTVRWVQATVSVLVALLLIAVAGGITANKQRNSARAQTLVAQSRQLVAEASSIRDTQPGLASQLLVQAYRLAPTPEAAGALIESYSLPRVVQGRGTARAAAYSSQGLLAVADESIHLFDPASMTRLSSLAPGGPVDTVAFSPDGRLLATGGADGEVRLLEVTSGNRLKQLAVSSAATGTAETLVFTPAGKLIVIAEKRGAVLDIRDPSRPRTLGPLPEAAVAASPEGNLIVTEDPYRASMRLWSLSGSARTKPLATITSPPGGMVNSAHRAVFSPNGQTLALGGNDSRVRLWDVADPSRPAVRPDLFAQSQFGIDALAFSPDGTTLATGDSDGSVILWEVSDPLRPRSDARLTGQTEPVGSLSFSPDGHTLASVSMHDAPWVDFSDRPDRAVRLWAVSGSERTSAFTTLSTRGWVAPSFSPDSRLLAAGGDPTTVWGMDSGETPRLMATLETFYSGGQAAAFGPEGRTLYTGLPLSSWDMTDAANPRRLTPVEARPDRPPGLSLNPALPLLATEATAEQPVQLWDISRRAQPTLLGSLSDTGTEHQALAFSPDGNLLAAATDKGAVRLWRVAQGTRPTPVGDITMVRGSKTSALAFDPHNRTLLVGDDSGSLTLWDASRPGQPMRKVTSARHTDAIRGLAVHPDGSLAATTSLDGYIRLWDVSDPTHPVEVTSLSIGGIYRSASLGFSPDGRLLAVSSDLGTQLWTVDRIMILQRLCAQSSRITSEQWAQYLPDRPYDPPCA
ncbi:TIR domain-containing protein [Streptomyces sp. NPDC058463]|uniref:WD40 domain-containing protein n=1 Tax=Streptomyces sp. NPDC058463 TaxID=3346510 RepID=UPI00365D8DD4